MSKNLTATLFILTAGLTLSATAVAAPFNHGSGFVNANSNVYSNGSVPNTHSTQNVQHPSTTPTVSSFNMYSVVESEGYSTHSSTHASPPATGMFTRTGSGFNDRS
ncbi:MAG TPA: hypothetical protein PLD30_15365 [Candidatus Competibacteraceae bacterium]|nr:hypothetical protein [Candidatus Competibacteraceae bacterium]